MASPAEPTTPEVFPWLKNLPTAPEYHPTLSEFQDPISYIFKIEKEASRYGICKIVPPVPAPPKKTAIANLNRSLASRSNNSSPESSKTSPTFTTRQQQIGFFPRKHHPVQKPVWKSGEYYTFHEFEAKAKNFEKNYLKRTRKKPLTGLEMETLFWKACVDKPFSVEYANDMPGSAFAFPPGNGREFLDAVDAANVGETPWNMRGVSRAKGSLLRFMKEEIPGVTSPMVYIAMMFSWFAWHVEDHDLHSLNYMHMGAGKTWYGVPRDAAVAFEEVVRVHGYGGEVNPLVTFAILGEKTTVMSPEVFISAGIPCCRLVQNAGDFVVTFPTAYHCGFSHGFNCGEAANIATPQWLRVAKDAAMRRASINYPPMVSHIQLLYDLALELCSSMSMSISAEPRSSRLKDRKRGEWETLIKELFVQNVMQNNGLLHILGKGSAVVLFPKNSPHISVRSRCHMNMKSRPEERRNASKCLISEERGVKQLKGLFPVKGISSLVARRKFPSCGAIDDTCIVDSETLNASEECFSGQSDHLPESGMLSCVTCGILTFACYAIVQPKEAAARHLMSADCSCFNDWIVNSEVTGGEFTIASEDANDSHVNSGSGSMEQSVPDGLYDVPILSGDFQSQAADPIAVPALNAETQEGTALGLLASTYGYSSESEEDRIENNIPSAANETFSENHSSESTSQSDNSQSSSPGQRCSTHKVGHELIDPYWGRGPKDANSRGRNRKMIGYSNDFEVDKPIPMESNSPEGMARDSVAVSGVPSSFSPVSYADEKTKISHAILSLSEANISFPPRCDDDSSRVYVFCLEHAVEVQQQLSPIGGAHILLVCNPEYPRVEAAAKPLAEELGINHLWNDTGFRDAAKEDSERIQSALDSEEAIPGNSDWTVKLGVNLFYSAILSQSPLYSKQMPYNSVMYNAFGCASPTKVDKGKVSGKQKKIVLAGKWCGKVWMSNQVHPFLLPGDPDEREPRPERERRPSSVSNCNAETATMDGILGRKRKLTMESHLIKKSKSSPRMEQPVRTSSDSSSHQQRQKIQRNKKRPRKDKEKSVPFVDVDLEGGPSTRLRRRSQKEYELEATVPKQHKCINKKAVATKAARPKQRNVKDGEDEEFQCDMEGCAMGFVSKNELALHKRNICPVKGCGKKFFSHKYLLQHRRVHADDRPLKCPWRGCKMTFKWAWARTEHIRVHTGARPYVCNEPGCGQTFRFVSDFSRHKRKTGHSAKKKKAKR